MQRKKRVKNNYIDAEEFLKEVIQSQTDGKCTDRLGQLLIELHDHILTLSRFVKKPPQIKDEIKSYSIWRILSRGILTFDTSSTARRCFNYFTTSAVNNMTQCCMRIETYERRHSELSSDMLEHYREEQPYSLIRN